MKNLKKLVILHSNDCEYNRPTHTLVTLKMNGKEVSDSDRFTVVLQNYHYLNMNTALDLSREEVEKNKKPVKIASDAPNVLEEYFIAHPLIELDGVPRVVVHSP